MDSASIAAHIHALTNDPPLDLPLNLLRDLPWEAILYNNDDPFQVYLASRLLIQIMTIEPNETSEINIQELLNNARHAWISGLAQTVTTYQHSVYLEICHAILKDFRKHPCESHVGFTLLSNLIRDKNSTEWIQQSLSTQQGIDLVPRIVLLIDIVKTCKVLDENEEFGQVSQAGLTWSSRYMRQQGDHWRLLQCCCAITKASKRYVFFGLV
ncbi:hypothetical protein BJV82DRAFT_80315 [Fennellomyces sp. T-0311]|nr:hypothetical protein BJV82DRAFT_80315 [Fennellomyces sp. T-0311]